MEAILSPPHHPELAPYFFVPRTEYIHVLFRGFCPTCRLPTTAAPAASRTPFTLVPVPISTPQRWYSNIDTRIEPRAFEAASRPVRNYYFRIIAHKSVDEHTLMICVRLRLQLSGPRPSSGKETLISTDTQWLREDAPVGWVLPTHHQSTFQTLRAHGHARPQVREFVHPPPQGKPFSHWG